MSVVRSRRYAFPLLGLALAACGTADPRPLTPAPPAASASAAAPVASSAPSAVLTPAASASVAAPEPPKTPPPPPLALVKTIAVGQWPEGIAISQGDAFVSESGKRTIARVDLTTGTIKTHIASGRLPVQLAAGPDGVVYALVHTDQTLIAIDPAKNRTRTVAKLPDYPENMTFADGAVWVLLWHQGSSANATIVRVDPANGKQTRSGLIGPSCWSVAVGNDHVWAGHDESISVLDEKTLVKQTDLKLPSSHRAVAAGAGAVFTNVGNAVARIDPSTLQITHRAEMGSRVALVAFSGGDVLAATEKGSVWRLDPATLVVKAEYLADPAFMPMSITANGEQVLLSDHNGRDGKNDDHGTLVVLGPR